MADTRRGLGYHPAFLSCLMLVISVVTLLQYTCSTSSGPAYLVTRPARSVLSKLDDFAPSESGSQPQLQIRNASTLPADVSGITDSVGTPAVEETPSQVTLMEPDGLKNADSSGNQILQSRSEESHGDVSVVAEIESLKANVPDSITPSGKESEPLGLNHTPDEFAGEEFVGSNASRESASLESSSYDANRDAHQVGQINVAKTELRIGSSEVLESSHGNIPPANEETVKTPDQVQSKDVESQEVRAQSMSTSQPSEISPTLKVTFQEPKLNPIFHELQACKMAINEATDDSADPRLHKLLYKNATAFSKSYELMERVFKVYIYKAGRKPLVHTGPMIGIYASEGQFIERMKRSSGYRTEDPSQAHMFFLPYSVQHMVAHLYVPDSLTMLPLATFIKEYVEDLARKHPFWNRTQGADHFYVSCHDWGPATARDHPTLRSNAMKVVCNADTTEEFVLGKDASLPEVYIHNKLHSTSPEKLGGPRYDQRPYLAFFAGQMHGRVRPILLSHWKDKDPDMKIYEVLPKHIARAVSYNQHMKMSKYCICAMGYEVNSPRIVEAIYNDCVPVIIADNFVLPFSDVLNWETFSVTIPEHDIPKLKTLLSEIPEKNYRAMQRRLRNVRPHFVWQDPPQKYDAFHMILHSVWTSRLNRLEQIRESASGELF